MKVPRSEGDLQEGPGKALAFPRPSEGQMPSCDITLRKDSEDSADLCKGPRKGLHLHEGPGRPLPFPRPP